MKPDAACGDCHALERSARLALALRRVCMDWHGRERHSGTWQGCGLEPCSGVRRLIEGTEERCEL